MMTGTACPICAQLQSYHLKRACGLHRRAQSTQARAALQAPSATGAHSLITDATVQLFRTILVSLAPLDLLLCKAQLRYSSLALRLPHGHRRPKDLGGSALIQQ